MMGLFDRFKKNNKFSKCDKKMWYADDCRNFAVNFYNRYLAFFDVIDLGFNEHKQIIFEEMMDLTSVWMDKCPNDSNSVYAAIILIGNNFERATKDSLMDEINKVAENIDNIPEDNFSEEANKILNSHFFANNPTLLIENSFNIAHNILQPIVKERESWFFNYANNTRLGDYYFDNFVNNMSVDEKIRFESSKQDIISKLGELNRKNQI